MWEVDPDGTRYWVQLYEAYNYNYLEMHHAKVWLRKQQERQDRKLGNRIKRFFSKLRCKHDEDE